MKYRTFLWLRRICQAFFLGLFILLLIQSRLPVDVYIDYSLMMVEQPDIALDAPVTFFFQIDPLVGLTSLLSGHLFINGVVWGLGVLVLTLLIGRFFCGFVCPLGTLNHMVSNIKPSLKGRQQVKVNRKSPAQTLKYGLLIATLLSALLGLNLSGVIDPISLVFRSLALAIFPAVGAGLKTLFDIMAMSDLNAMQLISYGAEEWVSPVFGYGYRSFLTGWMIGLLFLLVLWLNRLRPRFWCRFLCPLGALLGLFSRFSLLRVVTDNTACTRCTQCTRVCQGAAEPMAGSDWSASECLACFNCSARCPESAVTLAWRWPRRTEPHGPDIGRRTLMNGLTAGLALPLLSRLDGRLHTVYSADLIRPPGAVSESDFLKRCQRCGLCMKVCPTNVIQPTFAQAGWAGFWTPTLIMTLGYCEHTCNLCAGVCPTAAIVPFSVKEKIETPIRIGSAFLDRGRCLPWSGNGPCIVCEEHCPTSPKAIYLVDALVDGADRQTRAVKLPQVNLEQCTGCGICANKCIVRGKPAIRVIAAGESRHLRNRILL